MGQADGVGFADWFMGRTPQAIRRTERLLTHPVRNAILFGTGCGVVVAAALTLIGPRSLDWLVFWLLIGCLVGNLLLGPYYIWCSRKMLARNRVRVDPTWPTTEPPDGQGAP
jgi:membrane-associated phospholipid phosphatase